MVFQVQCKAGVLLQLLCQSPEGLQAIDPDYMCCCQGRWHRSLSECSAAFQKSAPYQEDHCQNSAAHIECWHGTQLLAM